MQLQGEFNKIKSILQKSITNVYLFFFRKVKLGQIEVKPLQTNSANINFVNIDTSLQIQEMEVHELAPNEFWKSLPIMELERVDS